VVNPILNHHQHDHKWMLYINYPQMVNGLFYSNPQIDTRVGNLESVEGTESFSHPGFHIFGHLSSGSREKVICRVQVIEGLPGSVPLHAASAEVRASLCGSDAGFRRAGVNLGGLRRNEAPWVDVCQLMGGRLHPGTVLGSGVGEPRWDVQCPSTNG
jgi:hypothetical protein